MSSQHNTNPGNVAGGLKATLKNPNVSEEAKHSAQERLENNDLVSEANHKDDSQKNEGNVIGGYKATLKNPNVSEEAKDHARDVLQEKGAM